MTLAGRLRAARYAAEIRDLARAYGSGSSPAEAARIQLDLLNREWQRILAGVPYFQDLQRERGLPRRFRSLQEFCERVPVMTRSTVQQQAHRLGVEDREPDAVRMTGGSTSEPIQIGAWNSENRHTRADAWIGRSWYGVTPATPLFLLWGHGHLLGRGFPAKLRGMRRATADRLLGYHRFSAYDLRPEAMRRAGDALLRFRPGYVMGYSVALDLLARANRERTAAFRDLRLSVVLGTAECFPDPESPARISQVFGAPVGMEYGAVETGVIAHTHPEGGYRVFWNTYLVEAERTGGCWHQLRVTSLYPRYFSLVRYEIGDEADLGEGAPDQVVGLERFPRLVGRCNDYVALGDGTRIHSEAFSHVMRPCPEVRSFQVVQGQAELSIRYTADRTLSEARAAEVRARLRRIHADLEQAHLVHVEKLPHTVAGKTRMVVAR